MKKIFAVLLALTMLFVLCVPAFAANATIDQNTAGGKGSATVQTDTSAITGDGTFTVTYPATMDVPWGVGNTDTSTAFTYSVTSQLKTGKVLQIAVAQDHDVMTAASTETLAYTLSGDGVGTAVKMTDPVVDNVEKTVNVNVAGTAWANAAIDTYQDTITFTASVVDA